VSVVPILNSSAPLTYNLYPVISFYPDVAPIIKLPLVLKRAAS
jgi:hypothetical protein